MKEELLLTPEEIEQGIKDYYWSEDMPLDTGISRENYAVALAQLAKAKPILIKEGYKQGVEDANKAERIDIEETKKQERETILNKIETTFSDTITKGEMTATNAWQALQKGE